ncbi:MAG TPA: von Willebrand factor type A domain-containing protein [Bacteroidia bacterium]
MYTKSLLVLMLISMFSFAQKPLQQNATGSICGKVMDATNAELLPFVTISLFKDSALVSNTTTDIAGLYCFKNLEAGTYKLIFAYVGYKKTEVKNVKVAEGKSVSLSTKIGTESLALEEVQVVTNTTKTEKNKAYGKKDYCMKSIAIAGCVSPNSMNYNTEEYSKIDDNEFKEAVKEPLSTFSIDVDKASYSNVRRFITQGSLPPADAVRVEEMINYFDYNYPQPKGNDPFSITTEFTECPWNPAHNLVHIGMQSKEIKMDNMPANNLVFLLDVSGSMNSADKLPLLKSGLNLLVDQMRPQDKVAIVVYAGAAGVVLPPTAGNEKAKIYEALEKLEAGGSTAGGEGILLAYKTAKENFVSSANNRVILATDGDFNVGVSSNGELTRLIEKERESGIFLTVLGFGTGNYKDSKMEQLADKGNGNYAYIDNILEAKKVLVKEMGGTLLTVAKDVKLQVEFNPTKVKAYRLVGYENRLLNNEDFNDDKKDAGELGSGHTVTAIYEIIPAGSSELVASVDPLKYQQTTPTSDSKSNEVMTIKFRYKEPKEAVSKLMTHIVTDKKSLFALSSENCKFSCAVAQFGMVLRESKFKGESTFKSALILAKASKGKDDEGYRSEFIRLIEMAELLKK